MSYRNRNFVPIDTIPCLDILALMNETGPKTPQVAAASPGTKKSTKPSSRLRELGIILPQPPSPLGAYVEASQAGSLLFISGTLPLADRTLTVSGRIGGDPSGEQGQETARVDGMKALTAARGAIRGLAPLEEGV